MLCCVSEHFRAFLNLRCTLAAKHGMKFIQMWHHIYRRPADATGSKEFRCGQLQRVRFCFATSALCGSGCCGRAPSACSCWLASSGAGSGHIYPWSLSAGAPKHSMMPSPSTLLERRWGETTLIRRCGARLHSGLAILCMIERRQCPGAAHGAIHEVR